MPAAPPNASVFRKFLRSITKILKGFESPKVQIIYELSSLEIWEIKVVREVKSS
jgi:hypothetical protein